MLIYQMVNIISTGCPYVDTGSIAIEVADQILRLVPNQDLGTTRPGKHTKNHGKPPFFMGKSTISMAIFNSKLLIYQRVTKRSMDNGGTWAEHGRKYQRFFHSSRQDIGSKSATNAVIYSHRNR